MVKAELCLSIRTALDVLLARPKVREYAAALGFAAAAQTRLVVAASELARNISQFAGEGRLTLRALSRSSGFGIEVVAEDAGPGMEDVERALVEGYSTSRGPGLGLPGAKGLMDDFEIESALGQGTRVTVRLWI